jgi:hypothetical protein
MGIKEAEKVQAKSIGYIFQKIKEENFPNLNKEMPIQVQEACRTQTDMTKIGTLHSIL